MKLTGKAKELFDEWCNSNFLPPTSFGSFSGFVSYVKPSMQWGVYQDWADSLGIHITTYKRVVFIFDWRELQEDAIELGYFEDRPEARTAAIEKLNQLINEKG